VADAVTAINRYTGSHDSRASTTAAWPVNGPTTTIVTAARAVAVTG
jgi:hypothetical protein